MPTPIKPPGMPGQQAGGMAAPIMGVDWGAQQRHMEDQVKAAYGGPTKSIFDEESVQNISRVKLATGDHYWDIIPYLAGPRHPRVVMGLMPEGVPAYNVEVYVHKNLRQDLPQIICLAKTFNLACPICEYRNQRIQSGQATDDEIKALYPGKHPVCGYNVWDRKNEGAGVQLSEISGFFLEQHLRTQAKMPLKIGQGLIVFQSPLAGEQGGRHITFHAEIGQNWSVTAVQFHIRKTPIPPHILTSAYVLDEYLYVPEYDEVADIFYGAGGNKQPEAQPVQGIESQPALVQPGQPVCPFGGDIGVMHGQYQECNNCATFEVCATMNPTGRPQQVQQPAMANPVPPQEVQQPQQPAQAAATKPQAGPRPLRRPQ